VKEGDGVIPPIRTDQVLASRLPMWVTPPLGLGRPWVVHVGHPPSGWADPGSSLWVIPPHELDRPWVVHVGHPPSQELGRLQIIALLGMCM
jgi:cell division inhibitor SulA